MGRAAGENNFWGKSFFVELCGIFGDGSVEGAEGD
jgi:hypothetical protein